MGLFDGFKANKFILRENDIMTLRNNVNDLLSIDLLNCTFIKTVLTDFELSIHYTTTKDHIYEAQEIRNVLIEELEEFGVINLPLIKKNG